MNIYDMVIAGGSVFVGAALIFLAAYELFMANKEKTNKLKTVAYIMTGVGVAFLAFGAWSFLG